MTSLQVLPLLSQLSDEVGYKLHITDLPRVFDCVNVHTCHNYQMPFTPETVKEVHVWAWAGCPAD